MMSTECCLNHPWVHPCTPESKLGPSCSLPWVWATRTGMSRQLQLQLGSRDTKGSTFPESQVPRGAVQVSQTHTIATAGQCLLLAISSSLQRREKHRNPLHTPLGSSRVCFFLTCLLSFQITQTPTSSLAACSVCFIVPSLL